MAFSMTEHFTYKYVQWVIDRAKKDLNVKELLTFEFSFMDVLEAKFQPNAKHTI